MAGKAVNKMLKGDGGYGHIGMAERASNGSQIYRHEIMELAEEYIDRELEGDISLVPDSFPAIVLYINDSIGRQDTADIDNLDRLFDIYIRLCSKCHVLPTLEMYALMIGISNATISSWIAGEYRSSTGHCQTAKKWFDICKSFTINRLHNKGGTDANLIFIAKAAYGMAETAPVQTHNPHQITSQTPEEIAARYGIASSGEPVALPEVPE